MLRVGKYDYKNKKQPVTENYKNVLIHTTGSLSPYQMKDEQGVIMENYWQFSKVFEKVDEIKQPISQYKPGAIRWQHPEEIHLVDDKLTEKYWNWRIKGFESKVWVRYPNGYKNHSTVVGTVIGTPDNYEIIDYITARKKVYYKKYREIAIQTRQFKILKKKLEKGECIQINEVDGPTYKDEYPYNLVVDGSIEINEKILIDLINSPTQTFGHGYSLAACLLGIVGFD